jgi:protein gp37
MSDSSKIEWTDSTWNCVTGCTKVSPGCDHCYAETFAERWRGVPGHHFEQGFDVRLWPDRLEIPLHWRKPRRVFTNSMSDVFHDDIPDDFIARMFAVMALTARHTFQVLTKRHGRMRSLLNSPEFRATVAEHATDLIASRFWKCWQLDLGGERLAGDSGLGAGWTVTPVKDGNLWSPPWPLPNVWLGVSVEDQKWADLRIPALLQTPAVVHFLSCEPLLGPVNIWHLIDPSMPCVDCDKCGEERFADEIGCGHERIACDDENCKDCNAGDSCEAWCDGPSAGVLPNRIDWIIAGGESGPGARPCELEWLRQIQWHCNHADVPLFVKQLGSVLGRELGAGPKGGDWNAWPEDLRIREFPVAADLAGAA